MIFSMKPAHEPNGETMFSSLALSLRSEESREECVRKDLTGRLERVCADLSRADFEALILKMTREQLRGERSLHGKTRTS